MIPKTPLASRTDGQPITDLRPGAEVFGGTAGALTGGALAEYALVPRDPRAVLRSLVPPGRGDSALHWAPRSRP